MMGGGMLGLGLIGSLISLVIIIIIGGIVLLVVWFSRQPSSGPGQVFFPSQVISSAEKPAPRGIVQKRSPRGEFTRKLVKYQLGVSSARARYARGEITFEQRQQMLSEYDLSDVTVSMFGGTMSDLLSDTDEAT